MCQGEKLRQKSYEKGPKNDDKKMKKQRAKNFLNKGKIMKRKIVEIKGK